MNACNLRRLLRLVGTCALAAGIIGAPAIASAQVVSQAWNVSGPNNERNFGWSVDSAGDVNGDGFDDVIIGAAHRGGVTIGTAYVYHGSSGGLATSPAWSGGGSSTDSTEFGYWVAGAGDVNGDGYDDVLVVDSFHDDGNGNRGRVWAYYGSATGLSASPDWFADKPVLYFGVGATGAGDVNGDGYDDVIISHTGSMPASHSSQCANEEVLVYLGSASGLSLSPDWTRLDPEPISGGPFPNGSTCFGQTVAAAGDVDADGYDDVIVGAPAARNWSHGKAYLFRGSATGLDSAVAWEATSHPDTLVGAYFGSEVSGIGDINADGYDDVVVQARKGGDPSEETPPMIYVYLGSASGLETTPIWSSRSAWDSAGIRSLSRVGDVDGDGFADLAANSSVPLPIFELRHGSTGGPREPAAAGFGPARSMFSSRFALAGAGDVNGDGHADIIVGVPTGDTSNPGYALVFHGGPKPAPVAQAATVETLENQSVEVTLAGSDIHDDPLTFAIESGPSNGSLGTLDTVSGEVTYTPDDDFVGADSFEFSVSDPFGGRDTATVDITVRRDNAAPSFIEPTPQEQVVGEVESTLTFTVAASDPDGDTLSFSASPMPNGATLDAASGEFSWRPGAADVGTHTVELEATDGFEAITRQIDLVVEPREVGDEPSPDAGPDAVADVEEDVASDAGADVGEDVSVEPGDEGKSGSEGCACTSASGQTGGLGMSLLGALVLLAIRSPRRTRRHRSSHE